METLVKITPIALSSLREDSVFQSAFWAEVKKEAWRSYAFRIEKGEVFDTVLVLCRTLFLSYSLAYIPFGPSLYDADVLLALRDVMKDLEGEKVFLIRFDLPWGSEDANVPSSAHMLDESIQPEGSVRIELPDGFVLHTRARRNIAKAQKVEVRLWDGREQELRHWYDTYRETGLRDGFSTRSFIYIQHLLSLSLDIVPRLYVAMYKGACIGGIITLENKNEKVYILGSSLRVDGISPGYVLQEKAINDAITSGIGCYDLFGIPGRNGRGGHLSSLTLFKTAFGGEECYRKPSFDLDTMPAVAFIFRIAEKIRYVLYRKNPS